VTMIPMIAEEFRRWLIELALLYIAIVAAGATLLLAGGFFLRYYWKFRAPRVVVCPETGRPETVEIDALHAASGALLHEPAIRLLFCSRWKERPGCGQECREQLLKR